MTSSKVLVTGGLGFIGSHLAHELVDRGNEVRILDNLEPQVHGGSVNPPEGLEFVEGDVRNTEDWSGCMEGVEVIFHQAASVGIGQSMYQIGKYVDVNIGGTANLLDFLVNQEHEVSKLMVASSNTVYGEGAYICDNCGPMFPGPRGSENLKRGLWEPRCEECGRELKAVGTGEDKPRDPTSIYAMSKRDQEDMALLVGKTYGIPTVALRYFNVQGAGQSLSNPYTGVASIFLSRIRAGKPPIVYEDGLQSRDFVNVADVVNANVLAMESQAMNYGRFNVGTGIPTSIISLARMMIDECGVDLDPHISGDYRKGDIRHCYAKIESIRNYGFEPSVDLKTGIRNFIQWAENEESADGYEKASRELRSRGLVVGDGED